MKRNFMLSEMTEEDIDAVYAMEKQSFSLPWTQPLFSHELSAIGSNNLVVKQYILPVGFTLAAYCCFRIIFDEMELLRIAVDKSCRRRGLGSWLLAQTDRIAKNKGAQTAFLEVRETNTAAIKLYAAAGYGHTATRPGYYQDTGEAAQILSKKL